MEFALAVAGVFHSKTQDKDSFRRRRATVFKANLEVKGVDSSIILKNLST